MMATQIPAVYNIDQLHREQGGVWGAESLYRQHLSNGDMIVLHYVHESIST